MSDDEVEPARRRTHRRRHRRVVAPPTNPDADGSDDVPARPGTVAPGAAKDGPVDARDDWIRAQRPPHWD